MEEIAVMGAGAVGCYCGTMLARRRKADVRTPGLPALCWERLSAAIATLAATPFRMHAYQSASEAIRAPSARAASFAQAMLGKIMSSSALVAKPQSVPAITFSRPTTPA